MINTQTNTQPTTDTGYTDKVPVSVQCHLLIKDKDTNLVIVRKRG